MINNTTEQEKINERVIKAHRYLVEMAEKKVKAGIEDKIVILRQVAPGQYQMANHLTREENQAIDLTEAEAFEVLEYVNGLREGTILESDTKRTLGEFLTSLSQHRERILGEFGGTINGRWFVSDSTSLRRTALEYQGSFEYGDTWTIRAYIQDPNQDRFQPSVWRRVIESLPGGGKNG